MIEISFKGDTPLEVLSKAAAFGLHAAEDKLVADAARQIMAAEKQARVHAPAKEQPTPTQTPVQEPPVKELAADFPPSHEVPASPTPADAAPGPAVKENGPTVAPTETQPVPTAEEVRAKGIEASRKYGTAAIKPILQEFNVSRITEIAEKDRAAFIARLEGLGEANA